MYNEQDVLKVTEFFVNRGVDSLQLFRFGIGETSHNKQLLDWLNPPQNAIILDAGCGIGTTAKHMKGLRQDLDFILLNISQAQLNLSPDNFKKVLADYHNIPLPDSSVDAVMFNYSIGYADIEKVFEESNRVLQNKGLLFINDVSKKRDNNVMESILNYKAYHPLEMIKIASEHGLKLDDLIFPEAYDISHLTKILPDAKALFDIILPEVIPTIFRFKK